VTKRPGRRPAGSAARNDILASARALFSSNGWEATSIRAIARAADVDPGVVLHYFGDKEGVFNEAMELPMQPGQAVAEVASGPRAGIGRRLVEFFLRIWEDPAQREQMTGLVRGAMTSAHVADLLRLALTERVLSPVAEHLDAPDGDLRVSLCSSHLVGLGIERYVLRLEPLASLSAQQVADLVGPTLQRYLTGDIAGASAPRRSYRRLA
jgi:AcrR family transcriptional regulator